MGIAEVIIPLGVLFILYMCLRGFLNLIHHWILNRTIREAMIKCPEAIEPLVGKLGTAAPRTWTPKLIGLMLLIGSLTIALAIVLELTTDISPDILYMLIVMVLGVALYGIGKRAARVAADGESQREQAQ
ncbi:MAG: hypothetical protein LC634_05295 [Sphingomonadales bacterium]|nr:hypothetical protein [Sphingomonadales bacterium]